MESSAVATTVVDIYNSSNQVLFEPGILDTVGNALLSIMPNLSAAPFLTNSIENSNHLFNEPAVNSTSNISAAAIENVNILRHDPVIIGTICLFYGIVFIFGTLGNILTIMVVIKLPRMRNVTNYFIVSLAFADLLVLILCLPGTLMSNIFIRELFILFLFFFISLIFVLFHFFFSILLNISKIHFIFCSLEAGTLPSLRCQRVDLRGGRISL